MSLPLKRGNFIVFHYVPTDSNLAAHPKALIIFGSGDGGPQGWEDRVCSALRDYGCEVISFNFNSYAATDYDLDTLQQDFNTVAQNFLSQHKDNPPPLIVGGWSMGAAQAVPVAGGPHPPPGLVGLLLVSPESRGRYGLHDSDRMNILPTGNGTFALQDFANNLGHLRVAQWSANLDVIGSTAWLQALAAPHKEFDFPLAMHDYNGASDAFLAALKDSLDWILSSAPPASK